VPATLCGYVAGGLVAYWLNRRHTFASARPHAEAGWRFGLVAFAGFCVTFLLMSLFVDRLGAPYLPAQLATTVMAMFVTFALNRAWTFG
jgi:putative flippase GtrA